MSELPASLRERVMQAAATRPAPTRQATDKRRILTFCTVIVAVGLFSFMNGMPHTSARRPVSHLVIGVVAFAMIAISAAIFMFRPIPSALGRSPAVRRKLAVAVPMALVLASLLANFSAPVTLRWPSTNIWAHIPCAIATMILGGIILALLIRMERGFESIAPRATGASLGAIAGAWTALLMAIECPYPDPFHVIVTHIAPVVLLVVMGMEFGSRWLVVGLQSEGRNTAR